MKKIIVILLFFLCLSCNSSKTIISPIGKFIFSYTKDNQFRDELKLREDSTYVLTEYGKPYTPKYIGKWHLINRDSVRLVGYISGYESINVPADIRTLKIESVNKLKLPIKNNNKYKYIILKRVKE